jgi:hypothetical protein
MGWKKFNVSLSQWAFALTINFLESSTPQSGVFVSGNGLSIRAGRRGSVIP